METDNRQYVVKHQRLFPYDFISYLRSRKEKTRKYENTPKHKLSNHKKYCYAIK